MRQRAPRERDDGADRPRADQRLDDAAPDEQQRDGGCRPVSTNCQVSLSAAASGIAAPRIAPIAAGPAPSRNALGAGVASEPLEVAAAD